MKSSGRRFFRDPPAWRAWLEANHARAPELWVGFHKKGSGTPSITWPESVDEALCFGWIDGLRKNIDEDRYEIRFTPRRPGSNWSAVNIRRMGELTAEGRVTAAGAAAFARRKDDRSAIYAYEQRKSAELEPEQRARFEKNRKAWAFFQAQPPSYRHLATYYVIGAKREETRARRLATLIADSARGVRIGMLERPKATAPGRRPKR
jgi:uncharacterized protein YdeI (YjbR/CyaY-like superfamily)